MELSGHIFYHGSCSDVVTPTFGLGDGYPQPVDYADFNVKYNERDRLARDRMDELIAGPKNKAIKVMSTLV